MPSKTLVGAAGVHYVVSELSLRGLIALPTIRNTAGIDILVSDTDGSNQANLQVKTRSSQEDYWPTSYPEKCLQGPLSFYVFVQYIVEERKFEAFLDTGANVARRIAEIVKIQKEKGRKGFPYWELPDSKKEIEKLRNNWRNWEPPKVKVVN
jgi:hypothetical protein